MRKSVKRAKLIYNILHLTKLKCHRIMVKCNHKVCNDCWYNITKEEFGSCVQNPLCPVCRNLNDWSK
jgi:hypothetical protein